MYLSIDVHNCLCFRSQGTYVDMGSTCKSVCVCVCVWVLEHAHVTLVSFSFHVTRGCICVQVSAVCLQMSILFLLTLFCLPLWGRNC